MNRLGFSMSEAEFLAFGEFVDLYREYQNVFDLENMLHAAKKTYHGMQKAIEHEEKPIEF
ncbi:MAG: hypothetical protein U0J62_11935 [Lachnospiraceae bacterium]|jgi:hypothetical protein|nr:hypothetical protein [Lachnospiraceae bacterium]DAR25938.1 MAG TPA: hypothetical protein [Caudoviricetes sp.]